jgi:hypothetical protein
MNTAGLLALSNGNCYSWADIFQDTILVQGITEPFPNMFEVLAVPDANGFLVKDWTFIGNGSSPGTYPYVWVVGQDAIDSPNGAPGQGNPNPPGGFQNHFIVQYASDYYDPSYGGPVYFSHAAWENASLDGFFRYGTPDVAKRNDPNVIETQLIAVI